MRIRAWLGLILLLVAAPADARPRGAVPASASGGNNGGMLVNLANPYYYSGFNQILNWWATGDRPILISSINGTLDGEEVWDCPAKCGTPLTYLETSTGELVTPVPADVTSIERGFFTSVVQPTVQYYGTAFGQFANQVFNVTWTGCASPTLSVGGSLGSGGSLVAGSNSATITLGSSGFSNVSLKFTMTAPCRADPPKNIKIFQAEYAVQVAAGAFWNPDFISTLQPFAYLRLMDVMHTNSSGISDSSQLAGLTYTHFGRTFSMSRSSSGNISGGVLTINNWNGDHPFQVGQRIVCIGCTTTITISSLGTGTGGNGTYNLTGAGAISVSGVHIVGVPAVGENGKYGPKGGWGPDVACSLANAANTNIEYPVPAAATDQYMTDISTSLKACLNPGLKVKFSYCNENWNSGGAFVCYRYVQAYNNNTPAVVDYAGYRAAQLMAIAADVFGTTTWTASNTSSRWVGAIGAQAANPSVATGGKAGAAAAITAGPIAYTLQQLFNQIDIAPYWGNFIGGVDITGVSAAATPTVTANNSFTNGQVIKLWVNGGTMASVLNGVYATVSNATGSNFQINISTTGLTYGGTNNGAFDATLFKLADQSVALNTSTPATYPTIFSYYAQQTSKAILNGSASDASYGTITISNAQFLSPAVGGVAVTGSLLDFFQQNALIAQKDGLVLSQYEGGPTWAFTTGTGTMSNSSNTGAANYLAQVMISQFDAGVVGDAVNTPANVYQTAFDQFDSVNGIYPAQFDDLSAQSAFGDWGALRFLAVNGVGGDTSNQKWSKLLAKNALGPWVDPTPAPTWSVNRTVGDANFGSGAATTLTCPVTVPADGLAVIGIGWTNTTATITSVSLNGGVGNMTQDAFTASSWSSAIYSKAVLASGSPYTATITWSSSAPFRNCAAVTLVGLASGTKISASSGNPQKSTTVGVTKGSFIFATATLSGAETFAASSTNGTATGTVTAIDKQVPDGQAFGFAYWSPGPSFSAAKFGVATNAANSLAVATYK
jgi:hypothetical protein